MHANTAMGKVHGSLSSAGKVRNQTPKIEKKEKKRPVTGRARRRTVFRRRYAKISKAGGGRLRLNPQS